jgi:hypothetical protein
VATLTYVYAESTAVVGPLATVAEPHTYDLCGGHARRLTVPRGWDVVRHEGDLPLPPPSPDELTALAEAVREAGQAVRAGRPPGGGGGVGGVGGPPGPLGAGQRPVLGAGRHLRVLPDRDD